MPSGTPCSVTAARPHRTDPVGLRGRAVHAGVKSTERVTEWAPVFRGAERPFGKVEGSGNGRRGRPRNCVNVLDTSELHAWWLRRYVSGQGYLTRYTGRFQEGRLLPCEGPGGRPHPHGRRALGWRPAPCGGSVSTDHRVTPDARRSEVGREVSLHPERPAPSSSARPGARPCEDSVAVRKASWQLRVRALRPPCGCSLIPPPPGRGPPPLAPSVGLSARPAGSQLRKGLEGRGRTPAPALPPGPVCHSGRQVSAWVVPGPQGVAHSAFVAVKVQSGNCRPCGPNPIGGRSGGSGHHQARGSPSPLCPSSLHPLPQTGELDTEMGPLAPSSPLGAASPHGGTDAWGRWAGGSRGLAPTWGWVGTGETFTSRG